MGVLDWIGLGAESDLARASFAGDKSYVKRLLDHGVSPNSVRQGCNALYLAILTENTAMVTLLLDAGADANARTWFGRPPLVAAVRNCHAAIVELLLDAGAAPDACDKARVPPLVLATAAGDAAIVELLLCAGANVAHTPPKGQSALYVAAERGYDDIVALLLPRVQATTQSLKDAMVIAATNGRAAVIECFLATHALSTQDDAEALLAAAATGHETIVRRLLSFGVPIDSTDAKGKTALLLAAEYGRLSVLAFLLDAGASVNQLDKFGESSLFVAARGGHVPVVTRLLSAKPDLNKHNKNGVSALVVAIAKGHGEIVRQLLLAGASLSPSRLFDPFTVARNHGHDDILQMLSEATAMVLLLVSCIGEVSSHAQANELPRLQILGRGHQGFVYRSTFRGDPVAVKSVFVHHGESTSSLAAAVAALTKLDCVNLVRLRHLQLPPLEPPLLVMEYVDGGHLRHYLDTHKSATFASLLPIATSMAHGLRYLHERDIVHGALKSTNVLLTSLCVAKLAGYGLPQQLHVTNPVENTLCWTSPEVLLGHEASPPADVYALGIVLVELETRAAPYATLTMDLWEVMVAIKNGWLRPELSPRCDPWFRELVEACLQQDPSARPSIQNICAILEAQQT
ncbi:TKL protein kinase [Saprolegnia parasitica CBS 223.65]|uniref:TKL protein kinase n=1 Tax=Saprolegnia parasitica (strain CBS 223.65) TaxID=695850 RepID=A0A067C2U0_SAPPC|nr:TKL protein kinase [Saprolegnia parasitica CBS 223.65]KDO25089.1 TKL protein kinase [Saprolegnia parasitica CBS 223.65]|eukprot:XP_012204163.1 TKL protein kinase [Saprolegnia parasitica CBS 223.65]